MIVDPNDAAKRKTHRDSENVIEEAKKCVVQRNPKEDSWAAINKGNKEGKSCWGRTKLPTFDFTQVPAGPVIKQN